MRETAADLLVAASWCAAAGRIELAGEMVTLAAELLEVGSRPAAPWLRSRGSRPSPIGS